MEKIKQKSKKNIAVISTSLNGGGAERIAGLLSKELAKYYNVYLFLVNTDNIIYEYGGTIVKIGNDGPFYEYAIKVNKKRYNIDVAISFMEIMNFANIRTRGKEKVIISERSVQSLVECPFYSDTTKIERYYSKADLIVTCSEGVKYDLKSNYHVKSKICTIYNLINKEHIIYESNKELPSDVTKFLNGYEYYANFGRLHPQKNQKRLIKQFAKFHEHNASIKLLIFGNGELKSDLETLIKEMKLEDWVTVFPYISNPYPCIKKSKAVVLSSHYEGLPNILLETMTIGVPIIATDCLAGPRELLDDNCDYTGTRLNIKSCDRGILVTDSSTEDTLETMYMAQAMKMITADNNECCRNFVQQQLIYMKRYTNKMIIDQWTQLINECSQEKSNVLKDEYVKLESAEKIYIYGAGLVGKSIYLRMKNKYKIDGFVVSNIKENVDKLYGINVYEISQITDQSEKIIFIIGVSDNLQHEVVRVLTEKGYDWMYPYIEPLAYDYYVENKDSMDIKKELLDWYRLHTGKDINIDNPVSYNEKIQWLKLNDHKPIKTKLADKVAVRDYIEERIGKQYLVPVLGIWKKFDDIPFDDLPERFALKCNHGSGTNLIVKSKDDINYTNAKSRFDEWMDMNYAFLSGFEMQYDAIERKIYAEQYIEQEDGDLCDYKLHCFGGKVKIIQVIFSRDFETHMAYEAFFDPSWHRNNLMYNTYEQYAGEIREPEKLDEMIEIAEKLAEQFRYVRVDLYEVKGQLYFGEMTFTPASGIGKWEDEMANKIVGGMISLE